MPTAGGVAVGVNSRTRRTLGDERAMLLRGPSAARAMMAGSKVAVGSTSQTDSLDPADAS